MDREEAKRYAPIIKAYAEGKTIERKYRKPGNEWEKVEDVLLLDSDFVYRIKEPSYRPFKGPEDCLKEIDKHTGKGYVMFRGAFHCIVKIDYHGIMLITPDCISGQPASIRLSFKKAMEENVRFMDKCPFGILEDEE